MELTPTANLRYHTQAKMQRKANPDLAANRNEAIRPVGGPWVAQRWPNGHPTATVGSNCHNVFVFNHITKNGGGPPEIAGCMPSLPNRIRRAIMADETLTTEEQASHELLRKERAARHPEFTDEEAQ